MMNVRGDSRLSAGQTGASLISVVCVLLVVASIVSLSLKLGPHYIDFRTIQSVIAQLPPNEVNTMPRAAVYEAIEKRFPLNNLYDFKVRDIIQYERNRDATVLTVAYEKRENLFMNVDVVIQFDQQYEFR